MVVQYASQMHPDAAIRSLRDVAFHFRHEMSGKDQKFVQQVQTASFLLSSGTSRVRTCWRFAGGLAKHFGAWHATIAKFMKRPVLLGGLEIALSAQTSGSRWPCGRSCRCVLRIACRSRSGRMRLRTRPAGT